MTNDVNGASDALILEALLPVFREGEDTVRIAIQNIQESLGLAVLDWVHIDPNFELAGDAALADFLQKTSHHCHIIINQYNIRLLVTNHVREYIEAKTLESLRIGSRATLFHVGSVEHTNTGRIGAVIGRQLRILLEAKVRHRAPRLFGQSLDHVVSDLAITGELMRMSAHQEELELSSSRAAVASGETSRQLRGS